MNLSQALNERTRALVRLAAELSHLGLEIANLAFTVVVLLNKRVVLHLQRLESVAMRSRQKEFEMSRKKSKRGEREREGERVCVYMKVREWEGKGVTGG